MTVRPPSDIDELAVTLADIVGSGNVTSDRDTLARLSSDFSLEYFVPAELAVHPSNANEVRGLVMAAKNAGWSVAVRGGAMSYTLAHTPQKPKTLLVDLKRLSAVREISEEDRFVIVEAGATWEDLYLELSEKGLRTPFWGPLSGRRATIGGSISQDSVFFGSERYGSAVSSVLGLEVVLANGDLLRTGSWAHRGGTPFSRNFGPDLTGLFLADSGSLGVKTAVALRAIAAPKVIRVISFDCASQSDALRVMRQISGTDCASDVVAYDSFYHGLLSAIGFVELTTVPWSVHATLEGGDEATVQAQLSEISRAVPEGTIRHEGGPALSLLADPFGATQLMFSSIEPGVHLPVHAVVPFSRSRLAVEVLDHFLREFGGQLAEHGVGVWQLMTLAAGTVVIEPSLYFKGNYRDPSVNAPTVTMARDLRKELASRFDTLGATHTQLARFYDFSGVIETENLELLREIKAVLDPERTLNPGVLGI